MLYLYFTTPPVNPTCVADVRHNKWYIRYKNMFYRSSIQIDKNVLTDYFHHDVIFKCI